MPSEKEMKVTQKAFAYDLQCLLESNGKENYTVEEIKKFIKMVVETKEQAP